MRQIFSQMLWVALSTTATVAGAALVSPVLAATFVYVGNAESNDIYVLQLNRQTGELTLVEKVPIPGVTKSGMSTPIAASPDRRLLFVATRGEPQSVATFAIDPTSGKLKFIGSGPLTDSMPFIAADRTGHFLFAASYPGHKLTVSSIGTNGVIGPTQQVLENHKNAHSILADAKNRYVLAATLGDDLINVFKFDTKTGKLEPHAPPSVSVPPVSLNAKAGPRHFVFHPKGKLVYVLGELDGAVHVFDYDPRKGQLKAKQSVGALPAGVTGRIAAADLHITPDGKFLYASDRTTNTLTGFKVSGADGTLTLIENIPTEAMPRSFSIDSSGRYLFVVGMRSHRMSSYRIEPGSGKLIKLKEYAMGKIPNWVEIVDLPSR
ncbi:MAG: beta-propeller fold lactonase family protein [Acidobacteriota bacterium]|nr:beta-propeller fold lactonase family protein [Acidobacteriota bacterium]